jgi:cytochrome P450
MYSFRVKFLIVPNQTSLLCHFLLADPNIIVRSARHYICIIPRLHPISLHSEHSESLDKTTMVREQRIQIRGIKGRIQQRVTMTGIMVTQKWSAENCGNLAFDSHNNLYLTNFLHWQVFCCIAIVGAGIIYWSFLAVRHLLAGPRKDRAVSSLPTPPRALTGNGSQPVWGHTSMFLKHGGDIGLLFPPDWREWKWLPERWSRTLGDCFSVFIWGQWRVVIRGPERVKSILDSKGLKEGWAWSPPVALLGKSCLPLLPDDEAAFLQLLLYKPLAHQSVIQYAPQFAEAAEHFVDDLIAGKFEEKKKPASQAVGGKERFLDDGFCENGGIGQSFHSARSGEDQSWHHQIKFDGLRSYTMDLMDGPVLGLNMCGEKSDQSGRKSNGKKQQSSFDSNGGLRDKMFLWMHRLKRALCVIKLSMGREWMYIWLLSQYGRAINGRMHLEEVIAEHVETRAKDAPVKHADGQLYHDPFVMPIPIVSIDCEDKAYHCIPFYCSLQCLRSQLTMTENYLNRHQTVTGEPHTGNRIRSHSEPNDVNCRDENCDLDVEEQTFNRETNAPDEVLKRRRVNSSPDVLLSADREVIAHCSEKLKTQRNCSEQAEPPKTILDHMLQQDDTHGNGLTKAVTTELCILLWMIMDAGNAWTAMALNLLSLDQSACNRVQQELDLLTSIHGKKAMFTPEVLNQMKTLDAVLFEAIRLCPPFLGGMKVTSETVELNDCGIQIPKNTDVIFCQPTDEPFDLSKAIGKKPEELGFCHPCPELHGFLPFKGMEVPVMVLQSKVFVAVLLQRCSPFLSKKRTFIRRVKDVFVGKSKTENLGDSDNSDDDEMDVSSIHDHNAGPSVSKWTQETVLSRSISTQAETTQTQAMKLFTKVPFPEPRRVINVRERPSALEILGVAHLSS